MGKIVDLMVARGHAEHDVEQGVWQLLEQRWLTLCGYTCRIIRRRGDGGNREDLRTYEFLLTTWSPEFDSTGQKP